MSFRDETGADGSGFSRRSVLREAGAVGSAGVASRAASVQETITVDMTDDLVFDPEDITVAPGTTVVWDNVGSIGHSVTAYEDDVPEAAEFFASGGFDSESAARSAYPDGDVAGGESFEHTFEVTGTHEYFCIPHESVGMLGTVEVVEGGGAGEGTTTGPALPGSALLLAIVTTAGLVVVVALAFYFLKYGGDYRIPSEDE